MCFLTGNLKELFNVTGWDFHHELGEKCELLCIAGLLQLLHGAQMAGSFELTDCLGYAAALFSLCFFFY
jgi:hypothetical protein